MTDDTNTIVRSSRLLATDRQMLLARVLLCVLRRLTRGDADQEFIDLYNDIKPLCENTLRKRVGDGFEA